MTETTIRGQKGMTSVKEMPVLQDGPPPSGFPAVRYARRIVNSGPSGATVLLVSSVIIGWGMYQVGQGNIFRRGLKAEKLAARQAIVPFLQAEEDARFVREKNKLLEEEAKVMAHVPGWKVGENVYNSGRWMAPSSGKLGMDS
ncbi:hypothetical protein KC19_VG079700 [Ceratodon purpureus]|uniref:NADH dehydrogenase [ubiquinone] 1 alpha subcomplex subunit 13 n=1 Tax=Ceratodon purpureus TaxID=3225 RepID=A0A8T0HN83_CERPU|nr:hypothetical protein KC19_VG079700 [Ceratodon purpureus]